MRESVFLLTSNILEKTEKIIKIYNTIMPYYKKITPTINKINDLKSKLKNIKISTSRNDAEKKAKKKELIEDNQTTPQFFL